MLYTWGVGLLIGCMPKQDIIGNLAYEYIKVIKSKYDQKCRNIEIKKNLNAKILKCKTVQKQKCRNVVQKIEMQKYNNKKMKSRNLEMQRVKMYKKKDEKKK